MRACVLACSRACVCMPMFHLICSFLFFVCSLLLLPAIAVVELAGVKPLKFLQSKLFTIISAAVTGVIAFLCLVMFGIVVDEYTGNSYAESYGGSNARDAEAVAAFSFFSIVAWVGGIAYMSMLFVALKIHRIKLCTCKWYLP